MSAALAQGHARQPSSWIIAGMEPEIDASAEEKDQPREIPEGYSGQFG